MFFIYRSDRITWINPNPIRSKLNLIRLNEFYPIGFVDKSESDLVPTPKSAMQEEQDLGLGKM